MKKIILRLTQSRVLPYLCLCFGLLLIVLIFGMADSSLATGGLSFNPPLDKLLHALVYGTIAALVWIAGVLRSRVLVWLLVVGIGIVDELQQRLIPGRESSLGDLCADMVGATLGLWLASWLLSRLRVRVQRVEE